MPSVTVIIMAYRSLLHVRLREQELSTILLHKFNAQFDQQQTLRCQK